MIDAIARRTPELADRLEQNVPYGQVARMPQSWRRVGG